MNDDEPDDENEPSPTIRRRQAKTLATWSALYDIVAEIQPATVRQTYYQCVVRNVVDKTEAGYHKVQANLVSMRREGRLPYQWITDLSRVRRKPWTNSGPEAALREAAENYRKSLWDDLNEYVEIWVEKDALVGVLYEITAPYDVPLMAARGFSSETYLNEAAQQLEQQYRPCFIYHLGDYDPSGWWAGKRGIEPARSHS